LEQVMTDEQIEELWLIAVNARGPSKDRFFERARAMLDEQDALAASARTTITHAEAEEFIDRAALELGPICGDDWVLRCNAVLRAAAV
jgi:hypothetical protein